MLCIRGASHGHVSVRLSVSVTSRSSTKTAKHRITQTTVSAECLPCRPVRQRRCDLWPRYELRGEDLSCYLNKIQYVSL